MKKIILSRVLIMGLSLFLCGVSQGQEKVEAKRMTLIKFDNGEIDTDPRSSLSKENALEGKKYSMKVAVKAGEKPGFRLIWESGLLAGKRGNWQDYDVLNIKYISEYSEPIQTGLIIADNVACNPWTGMKNVHMPVMLLSGKNTLSIDITNLRAPWGARRVLDLTQIRKISFAPLHNLPLAEDWVLYIQDVYVATEEGDYQYILKFHKGDVFTVVRDKAQVSLSKKHAKKKYSLKLDFKGGPTWVGEFQPQRQFWTGFSKVEISIYNDSDKERIIWFTVKGADTKKPNAPSNTFITPLKLPPGESEHSIDLTRAICADGRTLLDYSKIYLYNFGHRSEEPFVIYLREFKLVK